MRTWVEPRSFEQTQPGETDVAKSFLAFGVDAETGHPSF
jgi:hypothetical protein